MEKTLRTIVKLLVLPFAFFGVVYVLIIAGDIISHADFFQLRDGNQSITDRLNTINSQYSSDRSNSLRASLNEIRSISESVISAIWTTVQPVLKVCLILFVVLSFLKAIGIDFSGAANSFKINTQAFIGVLIIGAFVIASLISDAPASYLKDLSLVVVGFYFGTKSRDGKEVD